MPQFTIPLEGGGSMTVNASNQAAAINNVKGSGNTPAGSGGGGGGGVGGGGGTPTGGGGGAGGGGQYSTVNGLQTLATMASQLQNVGWGGNPSDPNAVIAAYASTTGGGVTPSGTSGGGGGGGATGAATPAQTDMSGLAKFAQQTSGITQAQLAQQKAEFDAQLQFARDQMQQLGIPQLQINQFLANLQQQQYQQQLATTQAQLTGYYQPFTYTPPPAGQALGGTFAPSGAPQQTLALGQLLGTFNGQQTEAAREFQQNLALQQGQLGQQYLSTAAQLQGPQNTFQLSNYLRGAQANPNVPTYLQSLANNLGLPSFQATGTTAPTPASAAGLAQQMGGQTSATPGWDYGQTLGTIGQIMSGGAQRLAPGSLERLTPDELAAFGSGLGAVGGSLPSFMQQYQQSRVGQTAPVAQTRLS